MKHVKGMEKRRSYYTSNKKLSVLDEVNPVEFDYVKQSDVLSAIDKMDECVASLAKYAGIPITDEIMSEIEGVIALFVTISGCDNYASMSAALFLYMRKHLTKSATSEVMAYVRELFEFESQSGTESVVETSTWSTLMKDIRENWNVAKENKLFTHFSKLLSLIVLTGVCEATDLTFSIKEFKVWEPDMKLIQSNAFDIFDAALTTVTYYVETISLCWEKKSLRPLMAGDTSAAEMDEEFANIMLYWDLVKNGNLMKVKGISDSEFNSRLEALTTKFRSLMNLKSSFEKRMIQIKFTQLLQIKNDYITMKISCGIREAPFALEFFGASSQGKTTCSEQIIDALLTSAGLPTGKKYQASYNASDKYMSNWTTDKLVMLIDDMCNDKSNFVERPPTRAIIDLCNNQTYYANMAEAEAKGKVFVEPKIVAVTTNVKDLDARVYSNVPYSVQRRMHVVITVEAKPEFQLIVNGQPQGLDSTKVEEHYRNTGVEPLFDDIWNLTLERAVQPDRLSSTATYAPIEYRGRALKGVPFKIALQYLIDTYKAHRSSQESIVSRMKNRQKTLTLCGVDNCIQIKGYCDLHVAPGEEDTICQEVTEEKEEKSWFDWFKFEKEKPKDVKLEPLIEQELSDEELSQLEKNIEIGKSETVISDEEHISRLYSIIAYTALHKDEIEHDEYDYIEMATDEFHEYQCDFRLKQETIDRILREDGSVKVKIFLDQLKIDSLYYLILEYRNAEDSDAESELYAKMKDSYFDDCRDIVFSAQQFDAEEYSKFEKQSGEENEKPYGEKLYSAICDSGSIIGKRLGTDCSNLGFFVEGASATALLAGAKMFSKHFDWISLLPSPWLKSPLVRDTLHWMHGEQLRKKYWRRTLGLWTVTIGGLYMMDRECKNSTARTLVRHIGVPLIGTFSFSVQMSMAELVRYEYDVELRKRNTVTNVIKSFRDAHMSRICQVTGVVGILYTIAKVYRAWTGMSTQGSLEPKTAEEVAERDSEANVWTAVSKRELPTSPTTANTTSEQLYGLVKKNLTNATVIAGENSMKANILFMTSNVVVLPSHYFETPELKVTFRKEKPDTSGGKFCAVLHKKQSYAIPNSDLCYCYCSSGGSFRDLSKYLCNEFLDKHEFKGLWRNQEGVVKEAEGMQSHRDRTGNGDFFFEGYNYDSLSIHTFSGLCGMINICARKPIIASLHVGGKKDTPRGCSVPLFLKDYETALLELRKAEGVIISGTAEQYEKQVLGVQIIKGSTIHPKSPLNYMPKDSQVEYFGECGGASTFRSDCKVTLISPHVIEVTGQPNIYRGPTITPQWKGWQDCLSNLALPAHPFSVEPLEMAIMDYKADLMPIYNSKLWNSAAPLADEDNMNGIPGIKFIDAIKMNTAIGFPLTGEKKNFIVELEPTERHPVRREFIQCIQDEIKRCEKCYLKGHRAYTVAKACKKDEILAKDKCRIFYGNPIALTWLVRKYYLPLLRVLQMNSLKSECAVGVNSHGPEWEQLHKFIFTHGEDRLIGGDNGKYDQKIPSQLLFASLRILIDFARVSNYSDEDIVAMEAMTGDLVFALIAFNGDLIGLTEGTHISGNSLTVILNGICGSLNLRTYFYTSNPAKSFESRLPFRKYVALMTYGDDNIGSVSKEIDNFTIKGASEFLKEYGQIYTMPDKESELADFLPKEEFEFLKRVSVYHPDLQCNIGALIDKSIFKMLHCYLRSKSSPITEKEACGMAIDTALREWFAHGREVFEMRREQMIQIAQKGGVEHLCAGLDKDYDARVLEWRHKYLGEGEEEEAVQPEHFDLQ